MPFGDELGDATLGRSQLPSAWRAAADPGELGLGSFRPKAGAELLEDGEGGGQRLPGVAAALRTTLRHPQCEQSARALEWGRNALVLGERSLQRREGEWELTPSGVEQTSAASRRSERGGAVEPSRPPLEADEKPLRLVEPAEHDQRLDLVGDEADCSRLPDAGGLHPLDQRPEVAIGLGRVPERQLEEPERGDA